MSVYRPVTLFVPKAGTWRVTKRLEQGAYGIFIGPEFGTVAREDLVKAARECCDTDCGAEVCSSIFGN